MGGVTAALNRAAAALKRAAARPPWFGSLDVAIRRWSGSSCGFASGLLPPPSLLLPAGLPLCPAAALGGDGSDAEALAAGVGGAAAAVPFAARLSPGAAFAGAAGLPRKPAARPVGCLEAGAGGVGGASAGTSGSLHPSLTWPAASAAASSCPSSSTARSAVRAATPSSSARQLFASCKGAGSGRRRSAALDRRPGQPLREPRLRQRQPPALQRDPHGTAWAPVMQRRAQPYR